MTPCAVALTPSDGPSTNKREHAKPLAAQFIFLSPVLVNSLRFQDRIPHGGDESRQAETRRGAVKNAPVSHRYALTCEPAPTRVLNVITTSVNPPSVSLGDRVKQTKLHSNTVCR